MTQESHHWAAVAELIRWRPLHAMSPQGVWYGIVDFWDGLGALPPSPPPPPYGHYCPLLAAISQGKIPWNTPPEDRQWAIPLSYHDWLISTITGQFSKSSTTFNYQRPLVGKVTSWICEFSARERFRLRKALQPRTVSHRCWAYFEQTLHQLNVAMRGIYQLLGCRKCSVVHFPSHSVHRTLGHAPL